MSYGTSLLTSYPLSYDLSPLASDGLFQRSSFGTSYNSTTLPYANNNSHLFSDDLTTNDLTFGSTNYRSTNYSQFPVTNYRSSPILDWRRDVLPQNNYPSLNNIREYSSSLHTSSNTNQASSAARSFNENFNGPVTTFATYQPTYNRTLNETTTNRSPHIDQIWNPSRPTVHANEEKPSITHRSIPNVVPQIEIPNRDRRSAPPAPTPLLPVKHDNHQYRDPSSTDNEKRQLSTDVPTSSNEKQDETPTDEKDDEQAWTKKIDKLHTIKAQREKEKTKTTRALPVFPNKNDQKPIVNKPTKPTNAHDTTIREASFQMRNGSYFDTLFEGNYFRKASNNQPYVNSSYQRTLEARNKPTTNSFNKSKETNIPKYNPPRKPPHYEPPSINRMIKKPQAPKQNFADSVTPREIHHKDIDERYREALNKIRLDRVDQQQREIYELTTKRLNYGDYVRRSNKDDLLQNAVKPSPWSDFIDLKKGHLLSLTKEEKKVLYNQSKSYGERVRFRNFAMHYGPRVQPMQYRPHLWSTINRESDSNDETSNIEDNDSDTKDQNDSKSLKRSSSSSSTVKSTGRTFIKKPINNEPTTDNQSNRTQFLTDQSSTVQASDEDEGDSSDFEYSRKQKRNQRLRKPESSTRTTSGAEETENDETSDRIKNRETDDELFTVIEEKTLESLDETRHKKR